MTQYRPDERAPEGVGTLEHPVETPEKEEEVELEGEHGKIRVKTDEVIEKLDELAEEVLPDKEEPALRTPTEENS